MHDAVAHFACIHVWPRGIWVTGFLGVTRGSIRLVYTPLRRVEKRFLLMFICQLLCNTSVNCYEEKELKVRREAQNVT